MGRIDRRLDPHHVSALQANDKTVHALDAPNVTGRWGRTEGDGNFTDQES